MNDDCIPYDIVKEANSKGINLRNKIKQHGRRYIVDTLRGFPYTLPRPFKTTWRNGKEVSRKFGSVNITLQELSPARKANYPNLEPRPVQVAGFIEPGKVGSRPPQTPQPSSGFKTSGELDVDNGHLIALELGGPNKPENIVPQWSKWQRLEDWRKMEQNLKKQAKQVIEDSQDTKSVFYTVDIVYRDTRDTGNITPTLVAWSFPKEFRVRTWVRNLDEPINLYDRNKLPINDLKLPKADMDQKYEGHPDSWSP